MIRHRNRQAGFSLIEVMLALVLGLILTGGAISLFIANKQSYRMADALARIQETGRHAIEMVGQDLRMAGHTGCAARNQDGEPVITATANNVSPAAFPPPSVSIDDPDSDGIDELVIHFASGAATPLVDDMASRGAAVKVQGGTLAGANQNMIIADCAQAEIFTVTALGTDASGNQTLAHGPGSNRRNGNLLKAYQKGDAFVMQMLTRNYSVEDTGDVNDAGSPIMGLFRNGTEILRGVENMQVRFGECVGTGSIAFRTWGNVTDPNAIVAARIGFLVYSIDNVLESADQQSYSVAGTKIGPGTTVSHAGDARLRRVFQTTVDLRNRPVDACHDRTT